MATCDHCQIPSVEISAEVDALAWSALICRACGQQVTPCLVCSSPCSLPAGRGSCIRCGALNPGAADANIRRVLGLPTGMGLPADMVRRAQEGVFGRRTYVLHERADYASLRMSTPPRADLKRKRGATVSPSRPNRSPFASQSTPSTSLPFLGRNATAPQSSQTPVQDSASPARLMAGESLSGRAPSWEAEALVVRLRAQLNCLRCRATLEQDLWGRPNSHSLPVCSAHCRHSGGHKKRSLVLGTVASCQLSSNSLTTLRTSAMGGPQAERDSVLGSVQALMEGSRVGAGVEQRARQAKSLSQKDQAARGQKVRLGGAVLALLTERLERVERRGGQAGAHCQHLLTRINAVLGTLLNAAEALCIPLESERKQSERVENLRSDYHLWLCIYHFVFHMDLI